jgi:hypothetical protein
MYSSNIAPPSESNHFNYHSNAFNNALATAKINKTCATALKSTSTSLQATTDNNIIVKSSSSDDAHQKQFKHSSPSIFDENNICSDKNKFSHGAYDSTYSHNIFDSAKHRNQLFNERM